MAKDNEILKAEQQGEVVLYQTEDGITKLDVRLEDGSVWLTQEQLSLLYGKAKSTISEHLTNIFEDGELDKEVVVRKNRTTTQHGAIEGKMQSHETAYYNLDVILAIGYRVRSTQGTAFRRWASDRLKNYIVKGFDIDVERLKGNGGGQYWYELLNTIKECSKEFLSSTQEGKCDRVTSCGFSGISNNPTLT